MTDPNISKEFESAFMSCGGGTLVEECGCGRTCFVDGESNDYEPGELEELKQKQGAKPDKFVLFEDEYVHFVEILGRTYVWGCPCNYAETAERLLWRYRGEILEYFSARTQKELEVAQRNAELIEKAKGGISD